MNNMFNNSQSLFLDSTILFAAQLVVVGHAISFFYSTDKYYFLQEMAVVIFFVLSGFLISYSLMFKLKTKTYNFKEYFIDRFARIYSGLFPSLLLVFLIDFLHIYIFNIPYAGKDSGYNLDITTFFANLLMLQDYPFFRFGTFGSARPLWTLSIEWWLYMTYGLITFYFLRQFNIQKLFYLFISLALPIHYIYGFGNGLTFFWFFGVTITFYLHSTSINHRSSLFFTILFLFLSIKWIYEKHPVYHPIFAILLSLSIFFVLKLLSQVDNNTTVIKSKKIIHFFASYTLTLYLIHYSLLDLLRYYITDENKLSILIFAIIASNIIACCLSFKTEMKYKQFSLYLKNRSF